ncbi:MAG: hypothetical protein IJ774_05860 [Selenomonadaceae bacterium]|nr:hypothetical protein [Selenomonadaceae bacterium]MBR1805901.1 hypothetical protein [Selenomonadaceae bacterium]
MLIKVDPTCWLNPQDVLAVTVCRAPDWRNNHNDIEISLRNGRLVTLKTAATFDETQSFAKEIADKLNAGERT